MYVIDPYFNFFKFFILVMIGQPVQTCSQTILETGISLPKLTIDTKNAY